MLLEIIQNFDLCRDCKYIESKFCVCIWHWSFRKLFIFSIFTLYYSDSILISERNFQFVTQTQSWRFSCFIDADGELAETRMVYQIKKSVLEEIGSHK